MSVQTRIDLPAASPSAPPVGRRLSVQPSAAPLAVGAIGALLSVAFSWLPSVWFDEAATISAAQRSWPELWRMLAHVDAVHGLYYAGMHLWFDLVGYTPFTLRLPSAIAVGAAGALVVLLVRRLASPRAAVLSGLIFVLLPRVTWAGTEGRSYALTAALAVALTLVFLTAWRSARSPLPTRILWWTFYGLLTAVSVTTFLYLVLLVAAHGATAVWTRAAAGRSAAARTARRSLLWWAAAAAAAGTLVLPFAATVTQQSRQVAWIDPIGPDTFGAVFLTQWFPRNPVFALLGWTLVIAGTLVLRRRSTTVPESARSAARPSPASLLLPWLVLPTLGLVVASLVVSPLYSPRYVTFTAPAAAILMGMALDALGRRRLIVTAVVLLVAVALPQIVAQRMPEAKQESSWSEVAAFIADQRAVATSAAAGVASAPEGIVYGPVRRHRAATTRLIEYAYPRAFSGLIDVNLRTPAAQTGRLWETRYPLDQVTDRLSRVRVVWLVTSDRQDWRPSVTRTLGDLGFAVSGEWGFTGVNVLRFER